MRWRRKDPSLPFDAKGLAPPPAWQVAAVPKPRSESRELPPLPEPPDIWPQTPSQVRSKTFAEARRGYDQKQVSTYLGYVADNLGSFGRHGWQTTRDIVPTGSDHIRRRRFATARRGFDMQSVDRYLEGLAAQMEALERSGRA